MVKSQSVNVTILIDESHKHQMAKVVAGLQSKGFVLGQSLEAIGVLTGSVPANALSSLTGVRGVSAVEEERSDYRAQTDED